MNKYNINKKEVIIDFFKFIELFSKKLIQFNNRNQMKNFGYIFIIFRKNIQLKVLVFFNIFYLFKQ